MRVWATRPAPSQTEQGCSGTRPSPPQTSQTAVRTSWPKRGAGDGLELAGAVAARAGDDRRAGLGAVAVAVLAALLDVVGDLDRPAARRVDEVDGDRDDDVGALDPPRRRARPRPEPKAPSKPPEPKKAENRSETEPKPSKFGAPPPARSPSCP